MQLFRNIRSTDRVLVTGGTGTLGVAMLPALLHSAASVRVLSRDETKQGALKRQFHDVEFRLGDVRDSSAVIDVVMDMDVIIHAASLKYVDLSEQQPSEYVRTNVFGTLNLVDAVLLHAVLKQETGPHPVRQVIGISTDKAAAPFNTYGLTKALLEKLFIEAHCTRRGQSSHTLFTVCRYGNVIGSRGSVVLKWQELTRAGKRIQVTDPSMTRFFFTVQDALHLIDETLGLEQGGVVLSQMMPSCTLGDLASLWGEYDVIGQRPGEKPHEDLLTKHETPRVRAYGHEYLLYEPLAPAHTIQDSLTGGYTSLIARRLTLAELDTLTQEWRT